MRNFANYVWRYFSSDKVNTISSNKLLNIGLIILSFSILQISKPIDAFAFDPVKSERDMLKQIPDSTDSTWYLHKISKEERQARFDFLVPKVGFSLVEKGTDVDTETCNGLKKEIIENRNFTVLEPQITDDIGRGDEKKIHNQCPELYPLKTHLSYVNKRLDEGRGFSVLHAEEKDERSDYTYFPTARAEYYNLKDADNKEFVGIIGDGVLVRCPTGVNNCPQGFFGNFVATVEPKVCRIGRYNMPLQLRPLAGSIYATPADMALSFEQVSRKGNSHVSYRERPTFTAFIKSDSNTYVLTVNGSFGWQDFAKLSKNTDVLIAVVACGSVNIDSKMCHFKN